WLHPVVEIGEADITGTLAENNKYLLLGVAVVVALIGIAAAWLVYERKRLKAIEPELFARGWYYDETVSNFMGGPGSRMFNALAWFDKRLVDGAVNGAAALVAGAAGGMRKSASGSVRGYAGVIGVGVVLILVRVVVVWGML